MMERVVSNFCETRNITHAERKADIAAQVFALFNSGLTEESAILARLVASAERHFE